MTATAVDCDGRVGVRIARFEVAALCLGNALGSLGAGTIPLWVAALLKAELLTSSTVGWLASGEVFLIAMGVLSVSAWGRYASPRRVAAIAAAVVVIANVLALYPTAQTLVMGRLLSGVAMGALLASVTGLAARRPDAQRILALMQSAMVGLVSVVYFVSPALIERFGTGGLFTGLAAIAAVMVIAALLGLPATATVPISMTRAAAARKLAPLIGCLALTAVLIGQSTIGTYIITIGNGLGFDTRRMGFLLGIAFPLALLGPLAAHRLGERVGLLRLLVFGQVLLAIDFFFLVKAATSLLLCLLMAGLGLCVQFCVPYAVTLLGRLDVSGRFASAAPAFMMIGAAAGPALGSKIISMSGFQALALVAASCIAVAIALFVAASCLGSTSRQQDLPNLDLTGM